MTEATEDGAAPAEHVPDNKDVWLVIPVYNEAQVIADVVEHDYDAFELSKAE